LVFIYTLVSAYSHSRAIVPHQFAGFRQLSLQFAIFLIAPLFIGLAVNTATSTLYTMTSSVPLIDSSLSLHVTLWFCLVTALTVQSFHTCSGHYQILLIRKFPGTMICYDLQSRRTGIWILLELIPYRSVRLTMERQRQQSFTS
jgi:hypothetical protein